METYRPLAAIRTTCGWLSSRSNSSSLPGLEQRPDRRVPVGPMGDKYFPSQSLKASFPHFSSSVYAAALPLCVDSFPSLLRKRPSQVDERQERRHTPGNVHVHGDLPVLRGEAGVPLAGHGQQVGLRMQSQVHRPQLGICYYLGEAGQVVPRAAEEAEVLLGLQGPATVRLGHDEEAAVGVLSVGLAGDFAILVRGQVASQVATQSPAHLQDEHVLPQVVSVFEDDADGVSGQGGGVGPPSVISTWRGVTTPRQRLKEPGPVLSLCLISHTARRSRPHLLPEVLQHVLAAAPEEGLQQHGVPLLVVHGLGDLTAQEPEEEAEGLQLIINMQSFGNTLERRSGARSAPEGGLTCTSCSRVSSFLTAMERTWASE
ncbi:hypothetical protein EYF80_051233 [Liparis tanakae]|uniref:Uncharacterized protein n=1 Tax=Liparis tanakae TaxID=230148 RepID=A0A4Z2FCI3_9TELE|nr:hypothetical protein EYF80_051233 [Liparis tanakae]